MRISEWSSDVCSSDLGASFVMNSATLAQVRKLKTADGAFLWQPGMVEGQPDRLLGYPVIEAEDMPDIAAGAFPIAFGNYIGRALCSDRVFDNVLISVVSVTVPNKTT